MTLTGVDPFDPTPSDRRKLILGAGTGAGGSFERTVLLFGNKTSGGSETVDVLDMTSSITDDANALARFGQRSELYGMYRRYTAIDPNATIYAVAVPESGGVVASCTLTVGGGSPTANATLEITICGYKIQVPVTAGATVNAISTDITDAINAADNGKLPVIATNAVPPAVVVSTANKGPRNTYIINGNAVAADNTVGVRTRWLTSPGATTVTKGTLVVGTTEDDATNAFASATNAENYYWVVPWRPAAGGVSTTDNQIGEALDTVRSQSMPAVGKQQIVLAGMVCTNADASTIGTASGINSAQLHWYHAEENDWPPCWIAAHMAAVKRSQEVAHPSANLAGYKSSDNTPWYLPTPGLVANRATAVEIRADLNHGVSPIGTYTNGATYLVRDITNRNLAADGSSHDYKAREGHIYSAVSFAWELFKGRYAAQKQPFVSEDPAQGAMPTARTTTPSMVRSIMHSVIDDLTSSKPLGVYDGPILAPDKKQAMRDRVVCTKYTAGIAISAELWAVEHNLKSETKLFEVGEAY